MKRAAVIVAGVLLTVFAALAATFTAAVWVYDQAESEAGR